MVGVRLASGASHMQQRFASGLLRTRPGRCNAFNAPVCSMSSHPSAGTLRRSRRVAVIGAGAAGLAAARELRAEGHDVTVLEQSPHVGGVWRFDPRTEDEDLLGAKPDRSRVHSSMYEKLRTNLPRELMSYLDFPFDVAFLGPRYSSDPRRFCGHAEVLGYLDAFADYFELRPLVRTRTRVLSIELAEEASAAAAHHHHHQQRQEEEQQHQQQKSVTGSAAAESLPMSSRFGFTVVSERQYPGAGPESYPAPAPAQQLFPGDTAAASASSKGCDSDEGAQAAWLRNNHHHHQLHPGEMPAAAVQRELYDAVVVCNGHYSEPRLPHVRGMYGNGDGSGGEGSSESGFPGQQLHSHNYRSAEQWRGKVVLVVGASNSGEDISRELSAGGARRVLLSAWSWKSEACGADAAPYGPGRNIYRLPMVSELHGDGSATFTDGRREGPIDAIIYCTGYRYTFPFLRGSIAVAARVEDNCVGPLWLHLLPPGPLAPGLSFVGLPWKVVPFPQFQLQSKLIARLLSGRVQLPSREQMEGDIAAHFEALRAQQLPKRYAHMQGQQQFVYNDLLAKYCGPDVQPLPWWRAELNRITGLQKRERPEDYRDIDLVEAGSDAASALAAASTDIANQIQLLTGLRGGSLDAGVGLGAVGAGRAIATGKV